MHELLVSLDDEIRLAKQELARLEREFPGQLAAYHLGEITPDELQEVRELMETCRRTLHETPLAITGLVAREAEEKARDFFQRMRELLAA